MRARQYVAGCSGLYDPLASAAERRQQNRQAAARGGGGNGGSGGTRLCGGGRDGAAGGCLCRRHDSGKSRGSVAATAAGFAGGAAGARSGSGHGGGGRGGLGYKRLILMRCVHGGLTVDYWSVVVISSIALTIGAPPAAKDAVAAAAAALHWAMYNLFSGDNSGDVMSGRSKSGQECTRALLRASIACKDRARL